MGTLNEPIEKLAAPIKEIKDKWKLLPSFLEVKGQIMSEWIDEVIDFPNYQLKNLKDFCPESFEVEYLLTYRVIWPDFFAYQTRFAICTQFI